MFALGDSQSQDSQRVAVSSATTNAQAMVLRYAGPRKDQERPEVAIRRYDSHRNSRRVHPKFDKKPPICHWDI
jgi:hypothetical protein